MKTVHFDIDTQFDFVSPAGALAVPGAARLLPAIAALNQHAWDRGEAVVSTTDSHSENDPEFRVWPAHCVKATLGQTKPLQTLNPHRIVVPNLAVPAIDSAPQYIVEKQALDCFTNVNLHRLIGTLGAQRYLVYGVVTEYCVRCALMGLLTTGARVELVADGVMALDDADSRRTISEFLDAGGHLTTLDAVRG